MGLQSDQHDHVARLFRDFYPCAEEDSRRPPPAPRRPIQVQVQAGKKGELVCYIAACPINRHGGYSGSGFPHPDVHSAFFRTPNRGTCRSGDTITLDWPASYYDVCATVKRLPRVYLRVGPPDHFVTVALPEGSPFRDLDYGATTLSLRDTPSL